MARITEEGANLWEYKVDNNANISSFVRLWKRPEGSTGDFIHLPCVISHHFLAIKTPILWVASSLQADVDLVGTNPEDRDSLLDNSFANVSLRVHSQQISWVFIWFTIPSLDPSSDKYLV